jgi:cellulose synthase/poly-beta-1,6-N-acetylglucosamine synthase-like glycosyltransferase
MTFLELIEKYIKNLYGIDLFEKAGWNVSATPAQAWLNLIFSGLATLIGFFVLYRFVYALLGIFGKSRKYQAHSMDKKYAFILSARNEEKVIGNLIDSIWAETYPKNLIDIYVVADNCSDKTAEVARSHGAHVYVRNDLEHCRKGYALHFLFEQLKKDIDIESYYGYCIMDSDNIVAPTFLEKMNDGLQSGYDMMSGYRNVKNLTENWITAVSGINMYRVVIFGQRPRSILNSDEQICGTGFIMRSYLLKDGWQATGLTEDAETMTKLVSAGAKMGYCEEAEFYDEQPDTVKIALRQRLRWAKGGIINWWENGPKLVLSFIKHPNWSKYDIYWEIFPYGLMTFIFGFLFQILSLTFFLKNGYYGYDWSNFINYLVTTLAYQYLGGFAAGIVILIKERKKVHFNFWEAFAYLFLWPLYDMIGVPISIISLLVKVGWKPIPHHVVAEADKLVSEEKKKERPGK